MAHRLAGLVVVGAAALVCGAMPASALEHHLVRWERTGRCEIVTTPPHAAGHWVEIGVYQNRQDARKALRLNQRARLCPPDQRPSAPDMGASGEITP